jgi:ABC-type glutathione transport system ATPase component
MTTTAGATMSATPSATTSALGTIVPVLQIDELVVGAIDGSAIVQGISLKIDTGEMVCIVGESGSGKSLTSLAVMGLLPPQTLAARGGRILLEGEDLLKADRRRLRALRARRMAMIFQEPMTALNPVMKVGRQIEETLRTHTSLGARERRAKALAMFEQVHLPDVERMYASYPHQLSGGQRQRIMIAMALILKPKLLIADEPTTALDVTTQKQILKLIKELQEQHGTAVLFITHDMGVVAEIADRVYVMNKGRFVETGPLDRILRTPQQDYTRRLLASVPSLVPRERRPENGAPITLETRDLNKLYSRSSLFGKAKETVAAKDVSIVVKRGRTLGIVGESGSGKSTVARCIMRLTDPTSGSVRVKGQEIATLSRGALRPHRKNIQMIFQDPYRSLNPRLTVADSIIEGPLNFGVPREEALARARSLLELVGLPADAGSRYPHQMSGGQRQRVAIARALAMDPDVLVADEAVSALDVSVQAQVVQLLEELQTRLGIALLFITHDLRVAAHICDDIVVMQRGQVVEYGEAADVLTRPQNAYTQQLLDAAPGRHWDFASFAPLTEAPSTVPA